jgi:UDP-N-acetylmuramoyl-tripeptide--D-alanyl-D-alanine ligase
MYSFVRLSHLTQWTGGTLYNPPSQDPVISILSSDTRTLKKGEGFIAWRGESFDGNQFLDQAAEKGAAFLIAEKPHPKIPTLVVADSLKALVKIASELRKLFKGTVVGITGSAGKSSTKEMVATLLGKNVVKSPASFNNLVGVSKTLCLLEDTTQFLVLEMGMNAFGEIAELCRHFQPEAGLITNIGDAHIGKLGGKEGIYRAKKELFDFLTTQGGKTRGVAVNMDDPLVVKAYEQAFAGKVKAITYSAKGHSADVSVMKQAVNSQSGFLDLELNVKGETFKVNIPIFGKHHAENIVAAISLVTVLGVPLKEIRERIGNVQPAYHRGEVILFPDGRVLIDESYNSNPTALLSALSTLNELDEKRRRILVIGEMRELGDFSEKLHREIGEAISSSYAGKQTPLVLIGVGTATQAILEVVKSSLPLTPHFFYPTVQSAIAPIKELFRASDFLLVKGSRGVQLDLLVQALSPAQK